MLIFISKNSLYDSLPKSNLKHWQLIRFEKYNIKRIASSKERNVVIDLNEFCNESNLELVVEGEEDTSTKRRKKNKKSNTYKNSVIKLKNLNEFSDNLKEDLNAMQTLQLLNNLSLLMMYYEFEHNNNEAIPNKKADTNEGNVSINEESISPSNENHIIQIANKGNEFDFLNSNESSNLNHFLHHHSQNISNFSDRIVMNGYEGQYEGYKCVCFFMFDNVFLHDHREKDELGWRIASYYNDVVSYFSDFT